MRANITWSPEDNRYPEGNPLNGYAVGVTLTRRSEYSRVLPAVAHYLIGEWSKADDMGEYTNATEHEQRLRELEGFHHDVQTVQFNARRSFTITDDEAEAAFHLLQTEPNIGGACEPAESAQRVLVAIKLGSCIGEGWGRMMPRHCVPDDAMVKYPVDDQTKT